jgi:hypothetical protein
VARDSIYYSQFTIHHFSAPGSQYTLKPKQDGQGAVLKNMPQGKKLKDTDSNRVLTALTDLRFTDVKKKSSTSQELKPVLSKLVPSIVKGAEGDNKTHITCQADSMGERPTTIRRTESEQQLKGKESKLFADDKAKEFTAKHQAPRRAQRRRLIVPERINWDPEKYDGLPSRSSKDTAGETDLEPLFSQ